MSGGHRSSGRQSLATRRSTQTLQWSKANPDDAWRDMWGWVTEPRSSATRGDASPPIEAAAPPGWTG